MKRVILAALFASVGIQCGNSFSDKSLEELKSMRDAQFDKIKEAPEYRVVKAYQMVKDIEHDIAIVSKMVERRRAGCESFRKNGRFFGGSEYDCQSAQMWEEILARGKKESIEAVEALIAKSHPEFNELCVAILEKSAQ
jgi:hypothetical protein